MIKSENGKTLCVGTHVDLIADLFCIIKTLEKNNVPHVKDVINDYYNGEFDNEEE